MINRIDYTKLFKSRHSWLVSTFHFSFAEYFDRNNMNFGTLRVMNDDIVKPNTGFETHPHQNMEIFTYVLSGQLTHKDSIGNSETLSRGDVQYMSAGTGITHSEKNENSEPLRFIQTWIIPDKQNHIPNYGSKKFTKEDRHNKWLLLLSNKNKNAININQDVDVFVSELDSSLQLNYILKQNRQIYLKVMEGMIDVNGVRLHFGDGAKINDEKNLTINAIENSHLMLIDLSEKF